MKSRNLLLMVFALCVTAAATTVIPMSVERLTRASTDIVHARALQSWSAWDASHRLIFTYTRFAAVKRLKGHGGSTFIVKQMGGSAGGYTQHVSGVRHFVPGEEALLFLHPSVARDGSLVVTGLMQGNFRVLHAGGETLVSNGIPGVHSLDPRSHNLGSYAGTRMSLSDLESRVQAVQP